MGYRYETHLHTCQASACGRSTGSEHVRFYRDAGYQGIIVTDHFFGGNTAVDRRLPWKECIHLFCRGYEDALNEGVKCGLDVFFGWEQWFDGDEYLIYGLDKQWLLQHPEMERWTRREQLEGVHAAGGCVIQAHPFRDRSYQSCICVGADYADGLEIANLGNRPVNDLYAFRLAQKRGMVMTAGSDNHDSSAIRELMGIETDEKLGSIQDLVRLIRQKGVIRPIVPEGRFAVDPAEELRLDAYWLDSDEALVPFDPQELLK